MTYYAKINWFNEITNTDVIDNVFFFAENWNDAMMKINSCFENINSIEMHEISDEPTFIFVPSYVAQSLMSTF